MYCINCGVKLSEGQTVCPICNTRVYHPDVRVEEKATYPKKDFESEEFSPKGILFVITILLFISMMIPLLFEITWRHHVGWSGYVTGGILLGYVCFVLPFWFRNANPVIFVFSDFAAAIAFLYYINYAVGGQWFLKFALPIAASLGAIITTVVALFKYVRRGRLYMIGGGLIAIGAWTVLIECLLYFSFGVRSPVVWSSCSFATLFICGMTFIIIALVKPLKESMRRIFFVGKCR